VDSYYDLVMNVQSAVNAIANFFGRVMRSAVVTANPKLILVAACVNQSTDKNYEVTTGRNSICCALS
jgi:hypothetical protein